MRLERFECKYLLSERQAQAARRHFAPHLDLDPFAARAGGHYPISSLYFDSPTLALHHATCEGQRKRYKLRIRSYSDDPAERLHLEIKRRDGGVITKSRAGVARDDLVTALAGQHAAATEFAERLAALAGRPMVLVRYEREAFQGRLARNARVTFDRRIMAARARGCDVRVGGVGWRAVEVAKVVLELKFTGRCPAWMARGVEELELRRQSYSKYSHAVLTALPQRLGGVR